MNMNIMIRRKS